MGMFESRNHLHIEIMRQVNELTRSNYQDSLAWIGSVIISLVDLNSHIREQS